MGKHVQRTYDEKKQIIEELLAGASYSFLAEKYNVRTGTISNWKRKYLEGSLNQDNRGRKPDDIDDVELLKKCYALLKKIRNE